LTAGY